MQTPKMTELPTDTRSRIGLAILGILALYGALMGGMQASDWVQDQVVRLAIDSPLKMAIPGMSVPASVLPGPPREAISEQILNADNAARMIGQDIGDGERWSDIAGNHYGDSFAKAFSYTNSAPEGPQAWLKIEPRSDTLRGRIEVRNLKPFFAYQMKLMGKYDKGIEQFEAIGHLGRWRLPGEGTNYRDRDYARHPDKSEARAYLLFDFFVTDSAGNAIREFALDSSLHVLWLGRQRDNYESGDALKIEVLPSNPEVYTNPKKLSSHVALWAEREHARYSRTNQVLRLPPGSYEATLGLTEESFHTIDRDGGYWATVLELPITFEITRSVEK